jgi:hypothetical protein
MKYILFIFILGVSACNKEPEIKTTPKATSKVLHSERAAAELIIQPQSLPSPSAMPSTVIDLKEYGGGTLRQEAITTALLKADSQAWLAFLLKNCDNIYKEDLPLLDKVGFRKFFAQLDPVLWIQAISHNTDSRIKDVLLGSAVTWAIKNGGENLPQILNCLNDKDSSGLFLSKFIQSMSLLDASSAIKRIPEICDLNTSTLRRFGASDVHLEVNALTIACLANVKFTNAAEAVEAASLLGEQRDLAYEGIFGALYSIDSLKASDWLNKIENPLFKAKAGKYLITELYASGDIASGDAWRNTIGPMLSDNEKKGLDRSRSNGER